ncbi:MAG: glycosyltransferase [Actinomycetota bacterium]
MKVLQVNTFDLGGGAEAVAMRLHRAYRAAGHQAWLAVKRSRGTEEGVFEIPAGAGRPLAQRALLAAAGVVEAAGLPGCGLATAGLRAAARPLASLDRRRGREDFAFPSTAGLPELAPARPDVLHLHNLHGNYFDLSALPRLSARLPVVWTLHDCWAFSGHCAHSFACERWKTGCGDCPDLKIHPAIARDATAFNWRRKQDLFAASRIYLATPSEWLMQRARASILWPAVVEARVIHNAVDDAFFAAPSRAEARTRLGLPADTPMLLFAANSIRNNEWKDFATLRAALALLAGRGADRRPPLLVALGEEGPEQDIGGARLRFIPFQTDPALVACWFAAADLYLHAARVETFSLTIAEAMACGTPVVATEAGAVAERIVDLGRAGPDRATGILVGAGDAAGMAAGADLLLSDPGLAAQLAANARAVALDLYRGRRQADAYLSWFAEIAKAKSGLV